MSRIQELIAELCPDGVPYLPIGDPSVSDQVVAGATPRSGVSEFWDDGTVPWMSSGEVNKGTVWATEKLITEAAYRATSTKLVPAGAVVVALAGQGRTRGTVARTRLALCTNQSLASIVTRPSVDADYLYHFLRTQYQKLRDISSGDGTRGGLNLQMIRAYRIPVPPLEVQREIVRILDTFAEMEAELEAALDAELGARRQQYEYHRDTMLQFPDAQQAAREPMAQVGEFTRGRRFTWKNIVEDGIPAIHYSEIYTHYGIAARRATSQVDPALAPRLHLALPGDVVIAAVGETVQDLAKPVAWLGDTPVAIHDDTFAFHSGLNPKYVAYWMQTKDFHAQKVKHVARAKVKRISRAGLGQIMIPVPPPSEQDRIVEVLDKLDALVNDLSIGLPAELAARRKQYEYYRERLLTFKEVPA